MSNIESQSIPKDHKEKMELFHKTVKKLKIVTGLPIIVLMASDGNELVFIHTGDKTRNENKVKEVSDFMMHCAKEMKSYL